MTQPACQVFAKFYKAMIAQCTFHSQPPADVIIPDIRWKSWKPECALSFNMGISILSRARENNWPVASQWQTLSHNVGLSKPHHEQDLNSQPQWWWARIAQVVVTPTTIWSRLRPPILIYFLFYYQYKIFQKNRSLNTTYISTLLIILTSNTRHVLHHLHSHWWNHVHLPYSIPVIFYFLQ